MSDEIASAALSSSQKAIEVMAELIRMLAPLAKSLLEEIYRKSVGGINAVGGKIANAKAAGTVSNKGLIVEAQKANSPISTTSNFLARDAELVAAKAKEYNIPVVIVGNGEKQTIEFLDRDKGIVEQITNEIMQERLREAPQSVKCFSIGENSVSSMKQAFEDSGIECQFVGGKDGKISCIYPAEYAEQVAVIKEDYKKMHSEVAENFTVEQNEYGSYSVYDYQLEKSVPITPLNKAQVSETLQEKLGYSAAKADIAANKLCYDLELDKEEYFAKPTQLDNLNALKTNIRYESDDITLRDVRFDAVFFKDGEDTHIVLQTNGKAVGLTPAKMTKSEMKDLCVKELGITEYKAERAVAKAVKIESQVRSQYEERTVNQQGLSNEAHIERTSNNSFSVSVGDKTKSYTFSTLNVDDKIAKDFDIPKENAQNIVQKAKNQSVLQNKIRNATKKKTKPAPEKPKLTESKVMKR